MAPAHSGGDHPFEAVSYVTLLADDINIDSPQEQKDLMVRTMRTPSTAKTGETMLVLGVPSTPLPSAKGGSGRAVSRDGEALLNSRSGRIHLFPLVDMSAVVAFHNFQASGGFLVSAAKDAAGVYFLEIEPRRDNTCRLMNPWPGKTVVVREAAGRSLSRSRPSRPTANAWCSRLWPGTSTPLARNNRQPRISRAVRCLVEA